MHKHGFHLLASPCTVLSFGAIKHHTQKRLFGTGGSTLFAYFGGWTFIRWFFVGLANSFVVGFAILCGHHFVESGFPACSFFFWLSSGSEWAIRSYGYSYSPNIFPIHWGAVWSYLEFLKQIIVMNIWYRYGLILFFYTANQPNDSWPPCRRRPELLNLRFRKLFSDYLSRIKITVARTLPVAKMGGGGPYRLDIHTSGATRFVGG